MGPGELAWHGDSFMASEVVDVGGAAVGPVFDVVDVSGLVVAVGGAAGVLLAGQDCQALGGAGGVAGPAHVQRLGGGAQDDRQELGVAGDPAGRLRGQGVPSSNVAGPAPGRSSTVG